MILNLMRYSVELETIGQKKKKKLNFERDIYLQNTQKIINIIVFYTVVFSELFCSINL